MANQNEAYDFSLFEPSRKEQEQQRPAPSKQPKKKNNLIRISEEQLEKSRRIKYKPTTVIGGILFSLIVLTIMGTMILSQVQLTEPVEGGDLIEAGEASSKMKLTLKKLGLPQDVIRRASICMYEGEINMVIHADGGQAEVEVDANQIVIRMTDTGPGIPDVEQAMQEGYSTAGQTARELGFGAGMGLPNMKRYSDEMTIDTEVGKGTTVTVKIKVS